LAASSGAGVVGLESAPDLRRRGLSRSIRRSADPAHDPPSQESPAIAGGRSDAPCGCRHRSHPDGGRQGATRRTSPRLRVLIEEPEPVPREPSSMWGAEPQPLPSNTTYGCPGTMSGSSSCEPPGRSSTTDPTLSRFSSILRSRWPRLPTPICARASSTPTRCSSGPERLHPSDLKRRGPSMNGSTTGRPDYLPHAAGRSAERGTGAAGGTANPASAHGERAG